MNTKANPGEKYLPRPGIKPWCPDPQPVVIAMSYKAPFHFGYFSKSIYIYIPR